MGKPRIPAKEAVALFQQGYCVKQIGYMLRQPDFPPFHGESVRKVIKRHLTTARVRGKMVPYVQQEIQP